MLGLGIQRLCAGKTAADEGTNRVGRGRRFSRGSPRALGDHLQKRAPILATLHLRPGTLRCWCCDGARRFRKIRRSPSLSPYPVGEVVTTIRTLAENDALRPRLVSQKLAERRQRAPESHRRQLGGDLGRSKARGQLANLRSKAGRACRIRIARRIAWWSASRHPMAAGSRFVFSKREGTGPTWPGILAAAG